MPAADFCIRRVRVVLHILIVGSRKSMKKRKFNLAWLVLLPVFVAGILIVVSMTREKEICAQGFRQYESHLALEKEQYLTVLDQNGKPLPVVELFVTGCIPRDTLLTDQVVRDDLQTALDAMAGYHQQVAPFRTRQEATSFLVDIFSTIIQSKYPAFFKTPDTSLIFELKGEGIPTPMPSPRLS